MKLTDMLAEPVDAMMRPMFRLKTSVRCRPVITLCGWSLIHVSGIQRSIYIRSHKRVSSVERAFGFMVAPSATVALFCNERPVYGSRHAND
jgi:hypothetical protein